MIKDERTKLLGEDSKLDIFEKAELALEILRDYLEEEEKRRDQ
jgi:hypothetical protein